MADTDLTERIRQRAYKIWESEGRLHGCDSANWLRAEADIQEGLKASGPAEKSLKPARKSPHKSAALSKRSRTSPQQRSRKG